MLDVEEQARELQRQYLREWRKKNKDKMQQYRKNYWLKKAQEAGETSLKDKANGGEQK